MFRSQRIIIREYVCTSLKLLNYLKISEVKILNIIPFVVAAKRVAGVRFVATTPGMIFRILNSVFLKIFQ